MWCKSLTFYMLCLCFILNIYCVWHCVCWFVMFVQCVGDSTPIAFLLSVILHVMVGLMLWTFCRCDFCCVMERFRYDCDGRRVCEAYRYALLLVSKIYLYHLSLNIYICIRVSLRELVLLRWRQWSRQIFVVCATRPSFAPQRKKIYK